MVFFKIAKIGGKTQMSTNNRMEENGTVYNIILNNTGKDLVTA